MASDTNQEQEPKIPVFTVLKNNSILKNIFLLTTPKNTNQKPKTEQNEIEDVLIVGRHPDCNIVLTHPSISRFHLQIISKTSSQTLFVTDLSSVHGTWVSDKKIEAKVKVELKEGDTLRLGGSSRVYKLHWVNLSQAYDLDNPFLSPNDLTKGEEETYNKDENGISEEELVNVGSEEVETNDNSELFVKKERLLEPSLLEENMDSEFCCGEEVDEQSSLRQGTEDEKVLKIGYESDVGEMTDLLFADVEILKESQNGDGGKEDQLQEVVVGDVNADIEVTEILPSKIEEKWNFLEELDFEGEKSGEQAETPSKNEIQQADDFQNDCENALVVSETCCETETPESPAADKSEEKSIFVEELDNALCFKGEEGGRMAELLGDHEGIQIMGLLSEPFGAGSVNSPLAGGMILSETSKPLSTEKELHGKEQCEDSPPLNSDKQSDLRSIWSRRGKSACVLQIQTGIKGKRNGGCIDTEDERQKQEDVENKSVTKGLFTDLDRDDNSIFTPDTQNFTSNTQPLMSMKRGGELVEMKKEVENKSTSKTLLTGFGRDVGEICTPDEDNFMPDTRFLRSMRKRGKQDEIKQQEVENKLLSKTHLNGSDRDEEEIFTPDKENFSPHTRFLRSMKKSGKLHESKLSTSCRSSSSKISHSPHLPLCDIIASCDRENRTTEVFQDRKSLRLTSIIKERLERVPFQSLYMNSNNSKSKSEVCVNNRSSHSVKQNTKPTCNNSIPKGKTRWYMVADSSCLLNKESRKALQLLQGLKGTQLIIPRIVIRELDCLKRRSSLFRTMTEVSSVLEWIEDCMVKTKWWIHVQSSTEEGRPIAPTPPASPRPQFNEESGDFPCGTTNSFPFSLCGSLIMDIVSPTTEDHILECAFLFKRMQNDGQFALLTNDVTLKIKAMAEGLICETAEEFRETLVNPFSERFLWAESSPRGLTWSCLDDVVLREKYKAGKSIKGLKLILLHNSHYR